ncbi:hypothetical protein EYZ11_001879 [Aspergillus tanneri]|uniref:N-acetyltransferase domain-containing protein n=1 Tax=Aspergillus tanneri TaxID=1220188 RepID=A0A4S3JSG8_9EURO|nr:hypothetical protein EYZ11_001879 [Aspergillus tanneri]
MIPESHPTIALVPINLHNPSEYKELQQQRVICGWSFSDNTLNSYREKQDQKLKSFFWITIATPEPSSTTADPSIIRAGHISLDSYADPPDPELAAADRSVLTIQNLFVLHEYRKGGVAHVAMDMVEDMASREPYGSTDCRFVTVNTMSKKYVYQEGPEWRGLWDQIGETRPTFSVQDWYERRGYVLWKEEERYDCVALDGREVKIVAAFLRKQVR